MAVFAIDKRRKPLMPCTPKRARQLLERGRAVVHQSYPFTIRIKDRTDGEAQSVRVKIVPGSKKTGIAVIRQGTGNKPVKVLRPFELDHREQSKTPDTLKAIGPAGPASRDRRMSLR